MLDEMMKELVRYPNGTTITIKWQNELEVKGKIDTMYDTDNGLDSDDARYKYFHACLIRVLEILKNSAEDVDIEVIPEVGHLIYVSIPNLPIDIKPGYVNLKAGILLEISIQNLPIEVKLEDGTVIWNKNTPAT